MNRVFVSAFVLAVGVIAFAQGDHVPAYNAQAPKPGELLPILPADLRIGENFKYPYQLHGYELAARIPGVISQLPCYCFCERIGHTSLHTCFESAHRAHYETSLKEVEFKRQQTKPKRPPAQLRDGIIKGEWKSIDLEAA